MPPQTKDRCRLKDTLEKKTAKYFMKNQSRNIKISYFNYLEFFSQTNKH